MNSLSGCKAHSDHYYAVNAIVLVLMLNFVGMHFFSFLFAKRISPDFDDKK